MERLGVAKPHAEAWTLHAREHRQPAQALVAAGVRSSAPFWLLAAVLRLLAGVKCAASRVGELTATHSA
jgi:hypothetical protein